MGDVIVKNISPLVVKLHRKRYSFSETGKKELKSLFKKMNNLFSNFLNAMQDGNPYSLQNCWKNARRLRTKIEALRLSHLTRLTEGRKQSIETNSVHLDLLDNIRNLSSYVKTMCNYFPMPEGRQNK